jgi:hypothetical protein
MVTIRIAHGRLELHAPYHPVLPFRSKQIGGKWLGPEVGWVFPLECLYAAEAFGYAKGLDGSGALRRVCLDIWAVDGSLSDLDEAVDLTITVDERAPVRAIFVAYQSPIFLVGREVAASLKNLRGARPGRGVKFLQGIPRCVPSSNSWMTVIPNGSVFIIRDVPSRAASRFREVVGDAGQVEVRAKERP